ncbi:Thioredoxin [Gracilaria domingensis]|nr:Thioredoxin [Gracilaria domingensis]
MPTNSLRRRRKASSAARNAASAPDVAAGGNAAAVNPRLKALLLDAAQVVGPVVGGVVAAASFRNSTVAVTVFVISVLAMILSLFFVFYEMLKRKDHTPIPLSNVYNEDGSVTEQPVFTVFDHDNKVATQLASQLPMFAIASLWFVFWTNYTAFFPLYTAFFVYRLFYHPLYRIYLWRETAHPDLERPFGASPIFKHTPQSAVKIVEGREQFQQVLKSAKKGALVVLDCSAAWCAPCRAMAPEFSKLAEHFKDAIFVTIDVDISLDLASDLRVTSIPSIYFYRDETLLQSEISPSPKKLRQIIESYM